MRSNTCCIVTGELGTGLEDVAAGVAELLAGEFSIATATYKGSPKRFYQQIAQQLDIPIETEDDKGRVRQLTLDQLENEIMLNIPTNALLLLPEAKRLTMKIRFWLEDLIANGCIVCCFAITNPSRDIFIRMIEVELELPDDRAIREAMQDEAAKLGYELTPARLSQLQPLAGRNPMLARKVVRQEKLGINQTVEHRQYLVMMPILLTALFSFAVIRYIGIGTGNKNWQIFGGVSLTMAMAAKQLGRIEGAKKRLGQ
ncbi:ATP-binding protein [Microcoleus sp. herbarium2]|uniref:ATP-binding protein n=1 Tax=Microcoleus sp. herbarium2 TaxID=3055433 RepID=UPI002FD24FCF